MNVTIKGIHPRIHRKLKAQAQANKRSLNGEVLTILERTVESPPPDIQQILTEARKLRTRFKGPPLTEKFLREARDQGRS